jgi:hypothetical protein
VAVRVLLAFVLAALAPLGVHAEEAKPQDVTIGPVTLRIVEKKGNYLIGTGCQAHACNSDRGFVAIDRKTHGVFLR